MQAYGALCSRHTSILVGVAWYRQGSLYSVGEVCIGKGYYIGFPCLLMLGPVSRTQNRVTIRRDDVRERQEYEQTAGK